MRISNLQTIVQKTEKIVARFLASRHIEHMQIADIKPKTTIYPKERTLEWMKLIHVTATLILQKNQEDRLNVQLPEFKASWVHCGDAAEGFRHLAQCAEWMGVDIEQIEKLASELK